MIFILLVYLYSLRLHDARSIIKVPPRRQFGKTSRLRNVGTFFLIQYESKESTREETYEDL